MVRTEETIDIEAIRTVHQRAFARDAEANLVDSLRAAGKLVVSLVAESDGRVVGHVALSPVTLAGTSHGLGLAPLAVLPDYHRRGIGARLVTESLDAARAEGAAFVVVLGDPKYYSRFGFKPASLWNLRDEYGGGDAFQAIELIMRAIPLGGGLVRYADEFALVA